MNIKLRAVLLVTALFLFQSINLIGQEYFRFKADFSIKEIGEYENKLTIGTVYYDANYRKLVMKTTFPEISTLLFMDTMLYIIQNDTISSTRSTSQDFLGSTMYHQLLTNTLSTYGLGSTSIFQQTDITIDGDLAITEWSPDQQIAQKIGKIYTRTLEGKLTGIVFLNPPPVTMIRSKQNFTEYTVVNGLPVPQKVVQQYYKPDQPDKIEMTKIYNYSNVTINDFQNNSVYDYSVPAN